MKNFNLNKTEVAVLTACKNEIVNYSRSEFGIVEDIKKGDLTQSQFKGYLGQLTQKGLIDIEEGNTCTIVRLTLDGCNFLLSIATEQKEIEELEDIKSEIY